jgi:hypothetical protein
MKTAFLVVLWTIGSAAVATGPDASGVTPLRPAGQKEQPPVVCGFRNTGYAGLCEEKAPYEKGKKLKELCKPILGCLNNPQCIKTYCGSSTIRQGWTLESAKRAKQAPIG